MEKEFYDAIFKRKSFHLFRGVGNDRLAPDALARIEAAFQSFAPLYPHIRTAIRIVPAETVNFKRDAEYCILIYSEKKENYLLNAGYLGEQLDLWLVNQGIGSLWFGIGKPDAPAWDGLDFVIMIAIHKVSDEAKFRGDLFKARRKPLDEIWRGDALGVAEIARFAPSACNSQPWFVENQDGTLRVYRYKKAGRRGIMPLASISGYNRIDMGIFLCFLELCLDKNGFSYQRSLFPDPGGDAELTKVAEYCLCPPEKAE